MIVDLSSLKDMSKKKLSFGKYLKAAFGWRFDVAGLGKMPLNYLALIGFGILGLGNPGFWLIGMAYEIGYLFFLAGNKRFQNLVRGKELLKIKEIWKDKQTNLFIGLDPPAQHRYSKLAHLCSMILRNADNLRSQSEDDLRVGGLNQLLWTFLKLLNSKIKINKILSQVTREDIEKEIGKITQRISRENEATAMYRSLQGTLEIEKKRLENLLKAEDSIKVVESELDRIEKQVNLLHEESLVSSDPEILTTKLDSVMQSLQGTSRWMSEHNELFGSIEEVSMPENLLDLSLPQSQKER